MAFSHSCTILWFASVIFVILPHFNLGLLSDYKICGDSECESPMSRVQAIRDHLGKDCRFLSFRRGDTILVYHKLTGKREDLWAGTIDRQFGYFPKDAVQEEQVYAAAEQVVETQKSDFICMDERGYPIDSSHLDNSDEDDDDDQNIQNQESETIQTIIHTDDSSAEHPSASIDSPSECPDQPDATSREEDKNQISGPTTFATREDTHETPAALGEQGGSPSSSWLGSSVTGWLGLGKEEQSDNMPEREEPLEEVSLTSSVTGWLGFGGEKKLDDIVKSREEDKDVPAYFTSTMTGWLGLGGEKEADHATKEQHEEREIDDASDPKETFRSRRMSLDLEGSQLQEEEKEVGTLGWLGKGLTSTFGFGATNLETDPIKEEKEKPTSSSWLDIGVGDILGFGKSESEVDESTRSNFKETEKDPTLRDATPSDQVDISESQPVQEEQKKMKPDVQRLEETVGMETSAEIGDNTISSSSSTDTNESNVEEHVVDHFSPLETSSVTLTLEEDVSNDSIAVSDASEGKSPPVDAAATVDQENVSPQTTSEENLQALDGTTPMRDEEGSAEAAGEGQQLHESTGNGSGNNSRELEIEENKSASDDRESQPNAESGSDHYSMESKGQYVENSDRAEHVEDDGDKITKQVEREESTMVGLELGGNNESHKKSNTERDKRHLDIYPTLTESDQLSRDGGSRGQSQSSSSSDTHKEENEPTHSEEDSVTAHSVQTDNLNTVDTTEDSRRAGESYNAAVQNRDVHSASGPSLYVKPPEDQMVTIHSKDPEPGFPENEEVIALKEKQEQFEEKREVKDEERQQRVEERKQKEDKIKDKEMQEEVDELQETEKQEDVKKVKEEEKQGEMEDEERNLDEEELKKEEIQEEGNNEQEEMKQEEKGEGGENTSHGVKELEEKEGDEEMVDVEGAKEGEKQGGQGESEKRENELEAASVEEQKQDEVESVEEEKEVMEVKEEEKQDKKNEFQVEEKEAEVEEFRKEKEEKEQQDEERQQTIAGSKEEEEEKEKEIQKSKEEEEQENLNKLNDSKEKGKETTVQVPHLETQKTNIHDIFEPELEISEETHDDNTKTEENKREEEQVKHDETQQLADVEEELRDKEEEESPKCSNKPCHQAPADEPAGVRNDKPTEDSMIQQNKQVLESETMSSEGTETDRLREEEADKASDDSDEGEETDITLNATGNETNINIDDHNGLKDEQIGAVPHTDNDQRPAGESGPSGRTGTSLGETWETKEHDHQAESDTVSQGPLGSGANNSVKVENASGGAFGLFKNAFSFFQTPVSKTKEPAASTPSVDMNTAETSTPQASLPVVQESGSTQFKPNSNQVPGQDIHKHSPVSISTQHRQPPPASAPSPSPETKSLSKYSKNLLGHLSGEELAYLLDLFGRNKLQFLDYVLGSSESQTDDPDNDKSILSDIERLLHHHRETLATSQEANENTKTLIALQKLEMLLKKLSETFNTRKSDVSKATLQADASCVGGSCSTNAKDEKVPKGIQDFSVAKDTKAQRDNWKAEEGDKGQAGGVTEESREDEVWKGRQKETQTHPHFQPGSPQPQEGVMKQSLDFVRQMVTDSITYAHATREVLVGITAQVREAFPLWMGSRCSHSMIRVSQKTGTSDY